MLDIGSFDRKIIIQKSTLGKDALGGTTNTWPTQHTCYSFVEFKQGSSSSKTEDNDNKINSYQSINFTIRNKGNAAQGITGNSMRVLFPTNDGNVINNETQYYNIVGVSQYGGREKYKVLHTELQTNNFIQP